MDLDENIKKSLLRDEDNNVVNKTQNLESSPIKTIKKENIVGEDSENGEEEEQEEEYVDDNETTSIKKGKEPKKKKKSNTITFTNTYEFRSNSCALEEGELDDYNEDDEKNNKEAQNIVQGVVEGGIHFGSSIANGITGIVVEPLRGAQENGAIGFFKGLGSGLSNVIIQPIKGSAGFITRTAEGLRNTPDSIFTDKTDPLANEHIKEKEADHFIEGLYQGSLSFSRNLFEGLTGVVVDPIKGAQEGGAKGFFKGLGSGLLGVVVKPLSGTLDLVGKPIEGIANTPKTIKNAIENKD